MPDRTQKIGDLSLHSCNNDISFASTRIGRAGLDLSGHRWFMILSLAWPSSGERSITITVSTNQGFSYKNFEFQ